MAKAKFLIDFTHSEESFTALAHMQYDLFCKRNYLVRTLIALACLCVGVLYLDRWWSYLLIVYGVFLATGKYNQSNHTAKKLVKTLEEAHLPFPSSTYVFENDKMRVISRPDGEELSPLPYNEVKRLGRDSEYYYLFRNKNGGYMIPKSSLGEREDEFVSFVTEKTGHIFCTKRTPPIKRLVQYFKTGKY